MTRSLAYEKSPKYYATRRAWYHRNRERLLAQKAQRRREDGDQVRARDRARDARNPAHKHGLTLDELRMLYMRQHGRCGICDRPSPMRGTGCLHIDHDHATGERRGLLCFDCNRALDVVERVGPTWALRALAYLSDPPLPRLRATAGARQRGNQLPRLAKGGTE